MLVMVTSGCYNQLKEEERWYKVVHYAGDVPVELWVVNNYNCSRDQFRIFFNGRWIDVGVNTRAELLPGFNHKETHKVVVKEK